MEQRKPAKSFEELQVWQAAHAFSLNVYKASAKFPDTERYGITSQMRRSAMSIEANIAEGFGRRTKADKARMYDIAIGSLYETTCYLILAKDLGYLTTDRLRDQVDEVGRLLNAYTHAVRK